MDRVHRTPPAEPPARAPWLVAGIGIAAATVLPSCAGPAIRIDNPGMHRCYLDGRRETRGMIPFRYYGTCRIDVLPDDVGKPPEWEELEHSTALALEPPLSGWWFPLDFFVEAADRALYGPGDVTTRVDVRHLPPDRLPDPESRPPGILELSQRAHAARTER